MCVSLPFQLQALDRNSMVSQPFIERRYASHNAERRRQTLGEHGTSGLMQAYMMRKLGNQMGWLSMRDAWHACQHADAIISSFTSDLYCASIAEKLGVPQISMLLQPSLTATRTGATLLSAPRPNHVSWLNYVAGKALVEAVMWVTSGRLVNRFRQEVLHLPHITYRQARAGLGRALVIHGYSRHVVPHPADWPPNLHTTGYWFLDDTANWTPPTALLHFLTSDLHRSALASAA
jgi:hypothetical protein